MLNCKILYFGVGMMKRIAFVFGILFVLIASCDNNNWDDSIITNNSLYPVSFKFNHTGEKNLAIGESTEFQTKAYQHLERYSPDKRVYFEYESNNAGYTGEFKTRQSWEIRVNNTLDENVTLSTNDWIDKDGKWIKEEYRLNTLMDKMDSITPGDADDPNHCGFIYSETPIFTVTKPGSEPPEIIAVAKYNKIGSILWVTIQLFP